MGPLTFLDDYLERRRLLATGTGIVMHLTGTDHRSARRRLQSAADEAGIAAEQVGISLMALYLEPRR